MIDGWYPASISDRWLVLSSLISDRELVLVLCLVIGGWPQVSGALSISEVRAGALDSYVF